MSEYSYIVKYLSYLWNNALLVLLSTEALTQVYKGYMLNKKYKVNDFSMIVSPKLNVKNTNVNLREDISSEVKEEIYKFIDVIFKNFELPVLVNFFNNINGLCVKEGKSKHSSVYNAYLNSIHYNYIGTIYHELFHMSSTHLESDGDNINCFTGFSFISVKSQIFCMCKLGVSLNEGYTELLTERYFLDAFNNTSDYYMVERNIASYVEKIVGKSLMERLYLNGNLKGLIDELNKYNSYEEITQFFTNFDLAFTYLRLNSWLVTTKIKKVQESLANVYKFLISSYINKLKIDLNNNRITIEELFDLSAQYIKSFNNYFVYDGINYRVLNAKDLNKILDDLDEFVTSYCSKNKNKVYIKEKKCR